MGFLQIPKEIALVDDAELNNKTPGRYITIEISFQDDVIERQPRDKRNYLRRVRRLRCRTRPRVNLLSFYRAIPEKGKPSRQPPRSIDTPLYYLSAAERPLDKLRDRVTSWLVHTGIK